MITAIQQHAIDRFKQRTGCKRSDDYVSRKIFSMMEKAEKTEFKESKFKVLALLNHGFQDAEYFKFRDFIFVVVDGTLKTIHRNEASRWE